MKILKYCINIILSFLIVFAIILVIAINLLNNKFLNKNYILSKMDETEFYLQVSREVESGFENYIYQSGLPEDTIKDLFTQEMLKKDVKSIVDCLYDGTDIVLSENDLRNNLEYKIQEYVKSQNITLNEQSQKNIKKFEDLITNEYTKNVNISSALYDKGHIIIDKIENISNRIGSTPIIILTILIVILIVVNIKDLLLAINFLGISSLTTGILFKIGTYVIFSNIEIDNLMILTTSISNLIISILKENLYKISDLGNIFIVCGIVGIFASIIIKNISLKNDKTKKPKRRFVN